MTRWDQGTGERGAVALREDGLVDAPNAAVAPGPARADPRVPHAGVSEGLPEGGAIELAGVVGADALERPAMAG